MYTLNSRNDMRWRKQRPQKVRFALNTQIFDKVRDLPAPDVSPFVANHTPYQVPDEVAGHILPPAVPLSLSSREKHPYPVVVQLESARSHA